jgi:fructokinase
MLSLTANKDRNKTMILCAGEALIDMLPRETTTGGAAFAPYAGGSVFNTAVALGRLGAPVQFFSGLSSDLFGDILRTQLGASHVDATPAHISDRPTTLAFVTLTDGHASYAFYDENTAGRMLQPDNLPDTTADAVFFGGISLVVEPCASAYAALMARVAPTAVTMIDPNIRPGFITDEAAYRARLTAMFATADIIKTSDEDLDWITGGMDARVLFDGTDVQVILLTKGSQGVTVLTRDGSADVPAQQATVIDTVGAGDTFSAGFLADLHKAGFLTKSAISTATMANLTQAAAFGARVAAITVARAGANPPWASEL